jgi:hypothetical protein
LLKEIQVFSFYLDETKIGFFGVGFYSLFSVCEEPFITSGSSTMGFFWKRDMLYTKRGVLPLEARSEWSTFYLACREPIELPNVQDFAKFLSTSLAFTTKIQTVEVFFDDERVLYFHRKGQEPRELKIPRGTYQLSSPHNLFTLEAVHISQIQLDVEITLKPPISVTIFMKIASGTASVSLPKKMAEEMYRTTKKMPPKTVPLLIMLSNFEEHDSTLQTILGFESIFEGLVPNPVQQGHVFIGFPTHQTTGCSIQAAGHFIPTVERESIDFVDKTLQAWNIEYLSMFGLLSRICFDNEVSKISELLGNMSMDPESAKWFYNKIGHNMNIFHFRPSTPSPTVGKVLSEHFNKCNAKQLELISANGTLVPISKLRLPPSAEMSSFIRSIEVVPQYFIEICPNVIEDYKRRKILTEISVNDVLQEISTRPLPIAEMIPFLKWWIKSVQGNQVTKLDLECMKRDLYYLKNEVPFPIARITSFAPTKLIPADLPIPDSCLMLEISRNFEPRYLQACFWNWRELSLMEWISFIVKDAVFGTDAKFTERVMQTISRHFNNCSQTDKIVISSHLSEKSCIVTQMGLFMPSRTYFPSVLLFDDLPRIGFENSKGVSVSFLKFLGVREHVDLQIVFDRITDLSWDQGHLIKYLSSIQDKLTPPEWDTLQKSAVFLKEGNHNQRRYAAKELYSPVEKFRALGVDVLSWNGKWKFFSDEGYSNLCSEVHANFRSQVPC